MKRCVMGGVTVFTRDLTSSTSFYSLAVGMKVVYQSKVLVDLVDQSGQRLTLQQADG